MPELPEVETVRRRLAPVLDGRVLERVEIDDPRLTRPLDPRDVARELEGERVASVNRRGKYLIVRFESGRALLVHLRMTGSFLHGTGLPQDDHRRALVALDDGSQLAYRDVRRFGTWLLLEPEEVEAYVDARVGREPLAEAYRAKHLGERLAGRRAPVKAALLDQRTVAGVGNIYADEALHRAGIHPLRPAQALRRPQVAALRDAVVDALSAGLAAGGATIDDFRHADGVRGAFQDEFLVHLRRGEACGTCGAEIKKMVAAGRGTYVCETCQPRPRARRRARPGAPAAG
ncbi:MAG TPA: bifunctional DNA-formamidopyrimidine glycosylase/DNA-(apurinic or apyrimidinic site) lyase, partial [Gaiellaceae bacterium]